MRAGIIFSEIMYDLDGSDTGREWVEIFNDSGSSIDLTGWKFNDGSNHVLNIPPKNGSSGSMVVPSGGYAVFAGDAVVFLSEYRGFAGTVIDTAMSLGNSSSTLSIIDSNGSVVDSVLYDKSAGANGDGNSLQKNINGAWVAAAPVPGAGSFVISGQNETSSPPDNDISPAPVSSGGGDTRWLVEPQVFADAGKDRAVIVGASAVFEAKAFGLKKEPLDNARYLWNFGDGAIGEGKMAEHTYRHPGDYLVVVEVASGYYSGEDQLKVRAEASPLSVSAITDGSGYFVELSNPSNTDINISHWGLALADKVFAIPKNTFVMAGKKLIFPNEVTGLLVGAGSAPELRYPNGTLASRFGEVKNKSAEVAVQMTPKSEQQGISNRDMPADNGVRIAQAEENDSGKENMAAVSESLPKKSSTKYIWLFGVVGISALALSGVFLARRLEQPNDRLKKLADEIEIIEE
ncbi:MAG: lamin tail domain-containing protein [Candidatus Paceibacterota bacterium]